MSVRDSRRHAVILLLGVMAAVVLGCGEQPPGEMSSSAVAPAAAPPEGAPRLIVYVVVDQLRADEIGRYDELWTGGFRRLVDEGTWFTEAYHDHAGTSTATGHATLATGALPRRHGIIGNRWFRREMGEEVEAVHDPDDEVSPRQLMVPALGDLLKARYPEARVFSVGGKDRATMFSAGHGPDGAYFYDKDTGTFVTSTYYHRPVPGWLEEFNDHGPVDGAFVTGWVPLVPVDELATFGIRPVDRGPFTRTLPRELGVEPTLYPDESYYKAIYRSPFVDEATVDLATEILDREALGTDEWPDLLAVTLAATDTVGHRHGIDSPERVDTLLRADRSLGRLLGALDRSVGLDQVVVSLASDHGVTEIPELLAREGVSARRMGWEGVQCLHQVGAALVQRFGPGRWLEHHLYVNRELADEAGVDPEVVEDAAAELVAACPGVARVHDGDDLQRRDDLDPVERLYANHYHPDRSPDLLVQLDEHVIQTDNLTTHGSPYEYDRHVPWIVRIPGGAHGQLAVPVRTVDVAPTLGALVGVEVDADGEDRAGLLRRAP